MAIRKATTDRKVTKKTVATATGQGIYTSGNADQMTLTALNRWAEANGCIKGVYK